MTFIKMNNEVLKNILSKTTSNGIRSSNEAKARSRTEETKREKSTRPSDFVDLGVKDLSADRLVVRIETDLDHVVRRLAAVVRVFPGLVEMLQGLVRIADIPCHKNPNNGPSHSDHKSNWIYGYSSSP